MEVNGVLAAAHDLKAPLTVLRQLALSLDIAPDDATRTKLQSEMVSVSERALKQINDLTKIARLEDGLFEMSPVSARAVCDEVYRELHPFFTSERRYLGLSYTNRLRLAYANHELLHSIIYNFCTNAARYSEIGTASQLFVIDKHGEIRIGVRDFGPALPPDLWRKLREGRLDAPTKVAMRPDSSGLGLYVASKFAQHMRARLGAIRHHDGVSFYIDLPISTQASLF